MLLTTDYQGIPITPFSGLIICKDWLVEFRETLDYVYCLIVVGLTEEQPDGRDA